jgi:hypothetical protein
VAGRRDPLVLIPRYTTYAGDGNFTTVPLDVSRFEGAFIHLWRGALVGTSPSIQFHFEASVDQALWTDIFTIDPGAATELSFSLAITRPLLRVRVETLGLDTVATCYAHGYLVRPS